MNSSQISRKLSRWNTEKKCLNHVKHKYDEFLIRSNHFPLSQIDRAEKQLKQKELDPKREWFQSHKERLEEQDKLRLDSYNGKKKKVSKEEREQFQKTKNVIRLFH